MVTSPRVARVFLNNHFPYEEETIERAEEMVRFADNLQDAVLGYFARQRLIVVASRAGFPDKAIVAFSWCLAQIDNYPELLEGDEVELFIWHFRGAVLSATSHPQISKSQICMLLDEFERRVQSLGYLQRTSNYVRTLAYMDMGLITAATELTEKWRNTARTSVDLCEACEQASYVRLLILQERDQEAISQAQPILQGKFTCNGAVKSTRNLIVRSFVRLNFLDEAASTHRHALESALEPPWDVSIVAEQLLYLIRTSQVSKSLSVFEKCASHAFSITDFDQRLAFLNATRLLFEQVADSRDEIHVRLPPESSCFRESNKYAPAALAKWAGDESSKLATAFDKRNGNIFCSGSMLASRQYARHK